MKECTITLDLTKLVDDLSVVSGDLNGSLLTFKSNEDLIKFLTSDIGNQIWNNKLKTEDQLVYHFRTDNRFTRQSSENDTQYAERINQEVETIKTEAFQDINIRSEDSNIDISEEEASIKRRIHLADGLPVTTFASKNLEKYEDVWRRKHNTMSNSEQNAAWAEEERINKIKAAYGDYIHDCIERLFHGEPFSNNAPKVNPNHIETCQNIATNVVNNLKVKHPHAQFFTEFDVISKKLTQAQREKLGITNPNINYIYGRIDLLVIDRGEVYIYDFKTSSKNITGLTNSWSNAYKEKVRSQLYLYKFLLEQMGFNKIIEENVKVLPILLNSNTETREPSGAMSFDNSNIISIADNTFQVGISPASMLREAFPPEINTTGLEYSETIKDDIDYIFDGVDITSNRIDTSYFKKIFVKKVSRQDPYHTDCKYYLVWKALHINYSENLEAQLGDNVIYDDESGRLYIKDSPNIDNVIEILKEQYSQQKEQDFSSIGSSIKDILESSRDMRNAKVENFLRRFKSDSRGWAKIILDPYLNNDWTVISNDTLLNQGILLLYNEDNQYLDIITLSQDNLNATYSFDKEGITGKDKYILSSVVGGLARSSDKTIDKKNILSLTKGHYLLTTIMDFISHNQRYFKELGQIRTIKAVNFNQRKETTVDNRTLQSTWENICAINYKNNVNNSSRRNLSLIDKNLFMSDPEALLDIALDLLQAANWSYTPSEMESATVEEIITDLLTKLGVISNNGTEYKPNQLYTTDDPKEIAKGVLQKALLATRGIFLNYDEDVSNVWAQFQAPALSNSTNVRMIQDMLSIFYDTVSNEFTQKAYDWHMAYIAALEEAGYSTTGKETNFFERWLKHNSDGSLDRRLILVDNDSQIADGHAGEAEKRAFNLFKETLADLTDRENVSEIPLVKASWADRISGMGFLSKKKQDLKELWSTIKKPITNEYDRFENLVYWSNIDERNEVLDSKPNGYFSTNLDFVLLHTLQHEIRKKYIRQFTPEFNAIISGITFLNDFQSGATEARDKTKLNGLEDWAKDFIKNKFLGQALFDDKWLEFTYTIMSKLTSISSLAQLGLNLRTFLREMGTSFIIGTTRSGGKVFNGIDQTLFLKALNEVMDSFDKGNINGELYQQNAFFRMANYDLSNLADYMKTGKWNPFNFNRSRLFIGTSLPDMLYRNVWLVAMQMRDGTYKTAYKVRNGRYSYKFREDPRFKALFDPHSSQLEFNKAVVLYNNLVDDINTKQREFYGNNGVYTKIYSRNDVTDDLDLPTGYILAEITAIRNVTDLLYGHFNDENKALMQSKFFWHFFMQYRTFMSARIEQNVNAPGATNIQQIQYVKSEDGSKTLCVVNTEDGPEFKWDTDLTAEEQTQSTPYAQLIGISMEGTLRNLASGINMFRKFKKHPELFKQWWADPRRRNLLAIFLLDTFAALIGMFLLNLAAFGEATPKYQSKYIKDVGYLGKMAYGVSMGMLQDGPIFSLLGSIDSINPPIINQTYYWYKDIVGIINGSENFTYALAKNLGISKEFANYFKLPETFIDNLEESSFGGVGAASTF